MKYTRMDAASSSPVIQNNSYLPEVVIDRTELWWSTNVGDADLWPLREAMLRGYLAHAGNRDGISWWGTETLANHHGCCRQTILSTRDWLVEQGFIRILDRDEKLAYIGDLRDQGVAANRRPRVYSAVVEVVGWAEIYLGEDILQPAKTAEVGANSETPKSSISQPISHAIVIPIEPVVQSEIAVEIFEDDEDEIAVKEAATIISSLAPASDPITVAAATEILQDDRIRIPTIDLVKVVTNVATRFRRYDEASDIGNYGGCIRTALREWVDWINPGDVIDNARAGMERRRFDARLAAQRDSDHATQKYIKTVRAARERAAEAPKAIPKATVAQSPQDAISRLMAADRG